ncbi:ATP-binding protein [Actinoallomurus sp. CA-150999]|uniref:ATP-binding protein n=1 Tax=Actinoallomurus sp. CA-150999 TaxID=3239887 RepID=UPI003D91D00A
MTDRCGPAVSRPGADTRTASAGNLPAEVTSFIGRRHELAEGKRLLSVSRLVTLVGVGGVGKTRLALRVAAGVRRAFPDGVWLVDLASAGRWASPAWAVADALGCQGRPEPVLLAQQLKDRRLLLVLDNCEHLHPECVDLVGHLLRFAPGLRVLATSRQVLGADGEHVLQIRPLSVPDRADVLPADAVERYEAMRLFADRATAVVSGLTIGAGELASVALLCRRLDGIPLAIELAAQRMRALSVEQLLDRLDDPFRLLRTDGHAVAPRQRTLRALVDWSHDLCSPAERTLWARLSVFADGCDLEAAERVCSGEDLPEETILEAIVGLVGKSILHREACDGNVRYRLLKTMRQYGRERLAESGQEHAVRRRHRDWCAETAALAETEWFGERQMTWLGRIRDEQADIHTALEFCLTEPGEASAAPPIAAAVWSTPLSWGSPSEGCRWLERVLRQENRPSATRAKALWARACILLLHGDHAAAEPLLEESGALAERLGDRAQVAGTIHMKGLAALLENDLPRASALLERARAGHRAIGDRGRSWTALFHLAVAAVLMGEERSRSLSNECLALCEDDARWSQSYALWLCGLERWRRGHAQEAAVLIRNGLRLGAAEDDHLAGAHCVEVLAWTAADEGRHTRAAELLGAARTLWRSAGVPIPGYLSEAHDGYERRLQRACGDENFSVAYARGANRPHQRVFAHALDEAVTPRADAVDTGIFALLTRREREVAELIAQGMSNKDIAGKLVIAQRTAEGHVERILRKLGFTSRTQIASAWTAQR